MENKKFEFWQKWLTGANLFKTKTLPYVTILLWKVLGAVGTISGLIPVFIWKQQSNAVHLFNVYRGSRT